MSEVTIPKEYLYVYNNSLVSISTISEDGNFRYSKYLMRMENLEQTLLLKNCQIPLSQFTELKESLFYIRNIEEMNPNTGNIDFEDIIPNEDENHDSNIINYNQPFFLQHMITNKYISLAKLTGNNNYILKLCSDSSMAVPFMFKRINETRAYQEFLTFNQTFYLSIFIKEKSKYYYVDNLENKYQNMTNTIKLTKKSEENDPKIKTDYYKKNFDNYSYLSIDKNMKTKYRLINQNWYVKEAGKLFPGQAVNILFSNSNIYKDEVKHKNRKEKEQQLMLGVQISQDENDNENDNENNENENENNENENIKKSKNNNENKTINSKNTSNNLFYGETMSDDFYYDVNKGFIGYLSETTYKNNKNIKVTAVPYEEDLYKHVTNNCFWILENEIFEYKEKLHKDPIKIGANICIKNVLLGLYLKIRKINNDDNNDKDNENENKKNITFREFDYEFELVDKETLVSNSFFFANFKLFHYNINEETKILESNGKYAMKGIFKDSEELQYDNFDFNQMNRYFQPVCLKIDSNNKLIVKNDNNFLFNIRKVDVLESSQYIYIKRIIDNLNFLIKKAKKNVLHVKNLIRLIAPNISFLTDYLMNLDFKFKDENYDINTPLENRQKLLVSYGLLSSIVNIIESLMEVVNEFEDVENYNNATLDYLGFDEMEKYFVNDNYSTEKNVSINSTRKLLKNILVFLSYLSEGNEEIKQMIFMELDIILNLAEKVFPFDRSILLNFIFKLIENSEILQEYVTGKCLNFGVLLKNPKIKDIYEKKQNKNYMKMDRILFYIETSHNYLYYYKKLLSLKKVKYRRPDIKVEIINHMKKVESESKTKNNYKVYLMKIIKRVKKIIRRNERPLYELIRNKKILLNKKIEEKQESTNDNPIDKFKEKNKIIKNKKIFEIKKDQKENIERDVTNTKVNSNISNLRSEEGLLLNTTYNNNSVSNQLINIITDNLKNNENNNIDPKKNNTPNNDIKPNPNILLTKNLFRKSHKEKLKDASSKKDKKEKSAIKGLFPFFKKLLGIPNDDDKDKKEKDNEIKDELAKEDENFNYLEGILTKFKDIKVFLEYFQTFDLNNSVFIHDLFFTELFGSYEQIKHNQTKLNYLINGNINTTNIIDCVNINKKNGLGPLFPFHLYNTFFPKIDKYKEIELKYNNKMNDIPNLTDDKIDSENSDEDEDTTTQNKFGNNLYKTIDPQSRKNIINTLRGYGNYRNATFNNYNDIFFRGRNMQKSPRRKSFRKNRIFTGGLYDNTFFGKSIERYNINNMFTEIGQKKIEDDLIKLNGFLSILYSSYQFCINQYFDAIYKLFQYINDYYVNFENFGDLDSMPENLLFINNNLLSKIVFVNNEVLEKLYSKAKENPTLLEGVFDIENFYENQNNLETYASTKTSRSSSFIDKDDDFLENETGYEFVKKNRNMKEKYKFKRLNAEEFYLIKNLFYYCRKFDKIMYILDKINYFKFIKKLLKHDDNNIMDTEDSVISNSIYEKTDNEFENENDYLMVGFHNIINKLFMKRNEILISYIRINDHKKLLYDSFKNKKEAKIQKFDSFRYNINKRCEFLVKLLTNYELDMLFGKLVYLEANDPPFFTQNSNILLNIKNIQRSFKEIKDEVKRIKINYDNKDNELMLLNTTFFNDAQFYFQNSGQNREIGEYTKAYSAIHFQKLNGILSQMTNKFLDFFRINAKGYRQLPKLNKMLSKENKNFYKKIGFDKTIQKLVGTIDYYCDFENNPNGKLIFCREILRIFMEIKNLYLNFSELIPDNFELYYKMIMKSLDTVNQYPESKIGDLEEKIFLHISYYSFQAFMLIIYNSMKNFEELRSYMIDIFTLFLHIYNKYKNPRNKVIFQILYTYYVSRILVFVNLDIYYNDFSYDSFYKIIYPTETMHIRILTCINEILQDNDTNEETAHSEKDEEEDEDEDDFNSVDKDTRKSLTQSNFNKNNINNSDNNNNNVNQNNNRLEEINTDINTNINNIINNGPFSGFYNSNNAYYNTAKELNTNLNINDLLNQNKFNQRTFNAGGFNQNIINNTNNNLNNNYQNKILSTWDNEEEKDKLVFYLNYLSMYVLFLHDKNSLKKIFAEISPTENESLFEYDYKNLYMKIEKLLDNAVNINSYINEQKTLNMDLNKNPLDKKLVDIDTNNDEKFKITDLPKQLQDKISEILKIKIDDSQINSTVIPIQKEIVQFGNIKNNFSFESIIIESIIYYRLTAKELNVEIPVKNRKLKKRNKSDEESFYNSNSSSNSNELKNDNKVIFYYYDNEYIDLILFEKIINDINLEDNMLYYCIKEDEEQIENSDFLKLILSMQKEYKLINSYYKGEYKLLHDQYINNDMKVFINSLTNSYTQKDFEKIEVMQNFLYKRMNQIYYDDIEETHFFGKTSNISFIEQLILIENKKKKAYCLENGVNLFTFFHSLVYLYPEYNKKTAILLYKIGFKLLSEKYNSQEEEDMRLSFRYSRTRIYDELNIFSENNLRLILDGLIKLFSRKLNQVIIEDDSIFFIICGSVSTFLKKMKTNTIFVSNNSEMIRSFFFKLDFVFDHLSKDFNKIVNFMKSGENQKNIKKYLKMENKLKCMLVFIMTFLGIKKDGDDVILTKNIIEFIQNITGQIVKLILILLEMGKLTSMKTADLLLDYIYYFIQGLDIENLNSLFEFHFFDLVTFITVNIDYHRLFLNNINKINLNEILDNYAIIEQKILKIFFVYYNVSHNDVKNIEGYLKIKKWYEDNYINAKNKLKRLYYLSKIEMENQKYNMNKSLIFFKSNDDYTDEELLMREGLINFNELNNQSFEDSLNKTLNEYITEYNTEVNTTDLEEKKTIIGKIENKNKSNFVLIKFDLLLAYFSLNVYYRDLLNEKYFHIVPTKVRFFKKVYLFLKKLASILLSLVFCIFNCFYFFYGLFKKKGKAKVDLLQEFSEIDENYQNINEKEMFLFLSSHIKCVEVVINHILYKIYFPLINKAKKIEENSEYYLHADSNDLPNYVSYLISHYDDIHIRVSQDYIIDKFADLPIVNILFKNIKFFSIVVLLLSIITNFIILATYSDFTDDTPCDKDFPSSKRRLYCPRFWFNENNDYDIVYNLLGGFGIVLFILQAIIFADYICRNFSSFWVKSKIDFKIKKSTETGEKHNISITFMEYVIYVFTKTVYKFISLRTIYYLLSLIFLLLGYFKHPFFYGFSLLELVNSVDVMLSVLKAMYEPGRHILITLLMFIMLEYLFSLFALSIFTSHFPNLTDTKNFLKTFMRMLDQTFKQDGGIGTYLDQSLEPGYVPYIPKAYMGARFWFDLLFFLIILLLIFQMFLSIIIDYFNSTRENRENFEKQSNSECLICGLEREFLEKIYMNAKNAFEKHVIHIHNIKNYINYLIYIQALSYRDPIIEESVWNLHLMRLNTYLPKNTCLQLKEKKIFEKIRDMSANEDDEEE